MSNLVRERERKLVSEWERKWVSEWVCMCENMFRFVSVWEKKRDDYNDELWGAKALFQFTP